MERGDSYVYSHVPLPTTGKRGSGGGGSSSGRAALGRSDHLIAARQRAENTRELNQAQKNYYERTTMHARFEEEAEASIRRRAVPRRVAAWRQADAAMVEARRDRLRELYDADSARWRTELLALESTPQSRVEGMRARVAELKAKREEERLRVVADKLEEHRRINCDELRAVRTREMVYAVTASRAEQVQEKAERQARERAESAALDAAWEEQRLKDAAKDEAARLRRRAADRAQVRAFEAQIAALAEAKKREQKLEQDYAEFLKQALAVQQVKEEHHRARQQAEARAARQELEQANRERAAQRAREVQQALEQDLKWIQSLLDLDDAEKEAESERKTALRRELLEFRDTVLAQRAAEAARVRELDRVFAADAERTWRARAAKWAAEQKAREKLMAEVIRSREEQLAMRAEQARRELQDQRAEREALEWAVAQVKRGEDEMRARAHREQQEYHEVLKAQIVEKHERRLDDMDREHQDSERRRAAEAEYQAWLQRELARPASVRAGTRP
ncbi:Cilia- and flagella-associated protein 53 [Blastocladiella emersonii ATCC 22665]|nr:Cilia- and flagella-associated protein 53 [Blastocladiella emersonii ATCC 22665]